MDAAQPTLLVTLTGRDRPGMTSRLFSALATYELSVLDIEQVVIRGRLVLGALLSCPPDPDLTAIHRSIRALAADLLAPYKPEVLLMVGTGALSRYLIEGHCGVRGYQRVLVWGRDSLKAAAVARDLRERGWPVGAT